MAFLSEVKVCVGVGDCALHMRGGGHPAQTHIPVKNQWVKIFLFAPKCKNKLLFQTALPQPGSKKPRHGGSQIEYFCKKINISPYFNHSPHPGALEKSILAVPENNLKDNLTIDSSFFK